SCSHFFVFPRPLITTLFPYTTLFRSPQTNSGHVHIWQHHDGIIDRRPVPGRSRRDATRGFIRLLTHQRQRPDKSSSGISATSSRDRKSTRLNSSHVSISYAVFCLIKK